MASSAPGSSDSPSGSSAADAAAAAADAPTAARLLSAAFLRCGVRRGGVLLAHSALSSFGRVAGGAETVLDALLDALGPGGTLVVPTLSYLFVSPDSQPRFDVRSTPTNLGAIPAAALRRAGALGRSLHPTHSCVALGARAQEVLAAHALDTSPVGPHSPFARVRELGGQVAFLGCPHGSRCNTSIHGVEEALEPQPPYLLRAGEVEYVIVDAAGAERAVRHRRHDFAGTAQRYERVAALMAAAQGESAAAAAAAAAVAAAPAAAEAAAAAGAAGGDGAGGGGGGGGGSGDAELRTYWTGKALAADVVVLDARAMWATARAALEAGRAAGVWPLTEATAEGAAENHHLVEGKDGSFRYRVGP